MTDMEHAIDRAANLRAAAEACLEDRPADPNAVELAWLVIGALGSGLLAPAPLTEEWGSEMRNARPDGDPLVVWAIDLDNAQWQIEHNPEWATGRVMHRYRTDWLPADGIDRSEGGGKAATNE